MAHFTAAQKAQLRDRGITEDEANRQLALIAAPVAHADLVRPCRLEDGIETIPVERQEALILLHEEAAHQGRCSKFVPASGAATRMFQDVLTGRGVAGLLEGSYSGSITIEANALGSPLVIPVTLTVVCLEDCPY